MRWKRRGVMRTASGAVIAGATVQVYLAGGATSANIYEASTGGAAISQVSADSQGRYEYYVDAADYSAATRFKEVITKGATSTTLDNIPIVRWDPTVGQSLAGDLAINGAGHGITFPDGSRQTTNATPGAGVSNTGDVSIAADTDANGSGEITLSTNGVARARVPNAGGLEINDNGTWRTPATRDGAETLSNKTLTAPAIGDFTNAAHDHCNATSGGALASPTMTNPVLDGSLSGTAIKDEDDMASDSATKLATQQSIKAYVDTRSQLITEWSQPDDDHPYLNAENVVSQGKATIKLPADKEAWVHGEFIAKTTGQNINLDVDYMMSTYDTDPANWGLAYVVGTQRLCDVPWQASTTYAAADNFRCPTVPNGCKYHPQYIWLHTPLENMGASLYGGAAIGAGFLAAAPTFTGVVKFSNIAFKVKKNGSPTGNAYAKLYNGAGALIATSNALDVSTLTSSFAWKYFTFASAQAITSAANHQVVVEYTGGDASNYIMVGTYASGASGLTGRTYTSGPTWSDQTWAPVMFARTPMVSGATEPTWPTGMSEYVGDNGILWQSMVIDNYDVISLTGETVPATAWIEGSKTFTIPGAGISEGDPINILLIRRPGSPEHSGDLHLLRATAKPVEA